MYDSHIVCCCNNHSKCITDCIFYFSSYLSAFSFPYCMAHTFYVLISHKSFTLTSTRPQSQSPALFQVRITSAQQHLLLFPVTISKAARTMRKSRPLWRLIGLEGISSEFLEDDWFTSLSIRHRDQISLAVFASGENRSRTLRVVFVSNITN